MYDIYERVKRKLAQIEESKKIIAVQRDKLREIYKELDTLLDTIEQGIEAIDDGKRDIERGIDEISQYL